MLDEATEIINKYPEVKGISYFYFKDTPKAWGGAETPDRGITDSIFKKFKDIFKNIPTKF